MLDKIKGFLPEPIKSKLFPSDSTEEVEEEVIDNSHEEEEESHDTTNKNSNDNSNSNRNSMIIRGVVVLAFGYLAVDHFFLHPQEEVTELAVPATPRKPRKKPIEPPPPEITAEVKKEDPLVVKNDTMAEQVNAEQVNGDSSKQLENKNDAVKTEEAQTEVTKVEETKPEGTKAEVVQNVDAPIEDINITKKSDESEKKNNLTETSTPAIGEEVKSESKTSLDSTLDKLIEDADGGDPDSKTAMKSEKKKPKKSLEDAIVEDIYVAPPQYEKAGRGLVYNCKEKHWACVDKLSYVACNKNMKYNKKHQKKAECAVKDVYDSEEDCATIQKFYVTSNKETEFCNN